MTTNSDRELMYSPTKAGGGDRRISSSSTDSADMLAALWRYRWAVILPALVGGIIGLQVYSRTPETYRSTTRLMVESDRPAVLDSLTGDYMGGVPSIDIVRSQLFSDQVVSKAFDSPSIQPFHDDFGNNSAKFIAVVQNSLELEPEVEDFRTAQSLVTLLHYESANAELCQAAVKSFSDALQAFFNEKQKSSRSELIQLIKTAKDQLHPKMMEMEQRYREFRRDAPLAWDSTGEAINPHRERQLFLIQRRSELTEKHQQAEIELASVESIAKKSSKDPLLGLNIIGRLLDKTFAMPTSRETQEDLRQGDNQLAQIELDQQLVPLIIERNKHAAEFGDNHPTVKALDSELATMKNEFKRLVEQQTSRIVELMASGRKDSIDPQVRAQEAVNAVISAAKAQIGLLQQQIAAIELQIEDERVGAMKLAQSEQENQAHLREIERTRQLLEQLEEQMARVSLLEEEGGTRVIELTAPSSAYIVGPNLAKTLGIGTFIGLALGAGLALLLEKNANTFRDPDEISELLGVPVLTHVPCFKGKLRKGKEGEDEPFKKLDPYLAVIHSPASVPAEAIRTCRTSVFFETAAIKGGKVIQVTSPLPGDGKSTVAGNLACSIAQSGKTVLAIDCDLRRPQLSKNFALSDDLGLTNTLNGDCEPSDAIHETPLPGLSVMPSGPIPANPAEALTLPEMAELLEHCRDQYDYIIIDTPPLLVVTDPSITASMTDGVLLTVRIRRKSRPNARESMNILRAVGANVLGVAINNSDEAGSSDGYRGYGYYRYGRYTRQYRKGYAQTSSKKGKRKNSTASSSLVVSGRGAAREAKPIDDEGDLRRDVVGAQASSKNHS